MIISCKGLKIEQNDTCEKEKDTEIDIQNLESFELEKIVLEYFNNFPSFLINFFEIEVARKPLFHERVAETWAHFLHRQRSIETNQRGTLLVNRKSGPTHGVGTKFRETISPGTFPPLHSICPFYFAD